MPRSYPNVATILHILSITPVTTASTERANSALKFVKSDRRSTMSQDRLNSLILLYVHKDLRKNYDAVVDLYASRYPRRMTLINPLYNRYMNFDLYIPSFDILNFDLYVPSLSIIYSYIIILCD